LFWEADHIGDDDFLQLYASFFIKLLFVRSYTSFLPSREIADFVARQPLSPVRSLPVDSLRALVWPFPDVRFLRSEAEAETFLWDQLSGKVTRLLLRIDRDGGLRWSETLVGQQEYE